MADEMSLTATKMSFYSQSQGVPVKSYVQICMTRYTYPHTTKALVA